MNKAFKFRLYPTKEQEKTLFFTLNRCRELYNAALSERKDSYRYTGRGVTYYEQKRDLPEIKNIREEYNTIHSQVLQDVFARLEKGMKAFFRRMKAGEKPGFPRFQGRNRYTSFTYTQMGTDKKGYSIGPSIREKRVHLPKIGAIKLKLHRPMQGTPKTCTIKYEVGQWYATFSCEIPDEQVVPTLPYTDEAIGVDLGLLHFATLSTGDTIENPRYYRRAHADLKRKQRKLSRCKPRSHRREKARRQVAKAHRKIKNQRHDFLHKQSRQLVNTYEMIVFEDLQVATISRAPKPKQDENGKFLPNGASKKAGLNKSILDAGWGHFVSLCQSKAEYAGCVTVLTVNPYKTSQVCSTCGREGEHKELSERTHTCVSCGVVLDRDHNAALNILRLGRSPQMPLVRAWQGPSVEAPAS